MSFMFIAKLLVVFVGSGGLFEGLGYARPERRPLDRPSDLRQGFGSLASVPRAKSTKPRDGPATASEGRSASPR
jgi:hypothetical protein